ncbi:hypothetical protein LAZ67_6001636 [Cordylochernes scorpioides]|uniref:DUF7045 domain-containing protein n=1 Tax=Cordylochernes scorpioides TaxID=51811 RepID=A0ABY6KJ85_9ARAC|nr:hypothetical protein LAZ67_6001636 [Cordylochernes scorpioides]
MDLSGRSHTPGHSVCPPLVGSRGLRVHPGKGALKSEICRDLAATVVGCRGHTTLDFLTLCASSRDLQSFHCHGDWEENGRVYLITGQKSSRSKYCFVYSGNDKHTQVSGLHDTCHRSAVPGISGNLTFNISAAGKSLTSLFTPP